MITNETAFKGVAVMLRYLTDDERRRVRGVLFDSLPYASLQTPAELHQLAMRWNWDDGFEPLQWAIRQPFCDQGTALLIYWKADPRWFCQWNDRPETIANNRRVGSLDLIAEIEERYAARFYTHQQISLDPRNTKHAGDLTRNYSDLPQVRALPEIMFQATPGQPMDWEIPLYDSFLRRPIDAERQEIDNQLAHSLKILRKHTGWITLEAQPLVIVKTIQAVANEYAQRQPPLAKLRKDAPLCLGWLWAEQLCRAYQWQWLVRDTEGSLTTTVFSPGQTYESHPHGIITWQLRGTHSEASCVDLFRLIGYAVQPSELRVAFSYGWVGHHSRPDNITDG